MKIIQRRKIYYFISGTMVIFALIFVVLWKFKYGIDFSGGSLLEIYLEKFDRSQIEGVFKEFGIENVSITTSASGKEVILRFKEIDEPTHQELVKKLKENASVVEELRFETVGPTIGKTFRQKAVSSIVGVLLVIALYIAFAFREVSRPVPSWKYGLITLVTLFHDIMAPIGLFSFLGHFYNLEIDSQFIIALLVVMGFSVHDTIVVFDRIRENLKKAQKEESFEDIVNVSVNETIVRSINTSLTTMLVLFALYIWGPAILRSFVLTLLVGIGVGTYSSIFIASPLLVDSILRKKQR
jgi:preprotein translocase subunit SecF